MSKNTKQVIMGFVYAIGTLVVLAVLVGIFSPRVNESEREPTVTEWPTPRLIVPPTREPGAATPTPRPTHRCPSPAEAKYLDTLDGKLRSMGAIMGMFGERLEEAGNNPLLMFDDVWVFGTETDVMTLHLHADGLVALQPPPSAEHIDRQVEYAMEITKQGLQIQLDGIKEMDTTKVQSGAGMISHAASEGAAIRSAMSRFCS